MTPGDNGPLSSTEWNVPDGRSTPLSQSRYSQGAQCPANYRARSPPLQWMVWPLMKPAASEQRKAHREAMSSV